MNYSSHTFESVWATLDRIAEQQAETARQISRLEKQTGGIANNHRSFAEVGRTKCTDSQPTVWRTLKK